MKKLSKKEKIKLLKGEIEGINYIICLFVGIMAGGLMSKSGRILWIGIIGALVAVIIDEILIRWYKKLNSEQKL